MKQYDRIRYGIDIVKQCLVIINRLSNSITKRKVQSVLLEYQNTLLASKAEIEDSIRRMYISLCDIHQNTNPFAMSINEVCPWRNRHDS